MSLRRTVVLHGPLAYQMGRLAAARAGKTGVQFMSLPILAARLAGGFTRPAESSDLNAAIRSALDDGGFVEFEGVRQLPGMTRAVARTLSRAWTSDLALDSLAMGTSGRLADLSLLDMRVRRRLPTGVLAPKDLRDAAIARVEHAASMLGPVVIDRLGVIEPVWRPLIEALCGRISVEWRNPGVSDTSWFKGLVATDAPLPSAPAELVTCANPRAEVVESLRWARELIASGRASPEEIAICATSPAEWDEHFVALSGENSVSLFFSHGRPAVASWDGQYCSALADVMLNGLSQDRVRRLLGYAVGRAPALKNLPRDWSLGIRAGATLMEIEHWRRALDDAQRQRTDRLDLKSLLLPVLETLATGTPAAGEIGERLLPTMTRRLWIEALHRAPPTAIDLSLAELRAPDINDAGVCVAWCPALHLASAPRRWVRLLGMTTRSWPRPSPDDPLLPSHLIDRNELTPESVTDQDRRVFALVTSTAAGGCVLSRSRRHAQGGLVAASPLLDRNASAKRFKQTRIPPHAFSETDRILARPEEAAATPRVATAVACWRDWSTRAVTPHDGCAREGHPLLARAIAEVQSATSLRRMLRDPQGFVWRYALGWRAVTEIDQPLSIDARAYGELVHELLKGTVDLLEPSPGYTKATREEVDAALQKTKDGLLDRWPVERPVPPRLLWHYTVGLASSLALKALTQDSFVEGTKSWTEVPFGGTGEGQMASPAPWDTSATILIPGTSVSVRGSIDRVDLKQAGDIVRVTDYKTGVASPTAGDTVLAGGAELQRVIYAIAARQLLPGPPEVKARLLFLAGDKPRGVALSDVVAAIHSLSTFVESAMVLIRQGTFLPVGPDVVENWNEHRLMLPASGTYLSQKRFAFERAYGSFKNRWGEA